ncbi:tagatose-6-phosphate kinase [Bacilli bacterium]|nr:tagatose-6-phosphate kinase [Bacilli bacterium]
MIVTVTMNPSIDIAYPLADFKLDTVNRCEAARKTAGGKGLNVSRILHQLDEPLKATGLLGGALGEFIKRNLAEAGIAYTFSEIAQETRNCIAILHNGEQTEILESGPTVSEAELATFHQILEDLLKEATVLAISGSLPKGAPTDFYNQLLDMAHDKHIPVVLDTSGASLLAAVQHAHQPYLIKPNAEEVASLLGISEITNLTELKNSLQSELLREIPVIVVSLGSDGALVKAGEKFYKVDIPKIEVKNPVGSGDSTVAGLVSGIYHKQPLTDYVKKAMVLGMLNAQEATTGYVNLANYDNFYRQIKVSEVESGTKKIKKREL